MKLARANKAEARLENRRKAYNYLDAKTKPSAKRPGSLNPKKG